MSGHLSLSVSVTKPVSRNTKSHLTHGLYDARPTITFLAAEHHRR